MSGPQCLKCSHKKQWTAKAFMARAEHYFMLVDCCLDIICFVASLTMKNCHLVVKMQPSAPSTSGSGVVVSAIMLRTCYYWMLNEPQLVQLISLFVYVMDQSIWEGDSCLSIAVAPSWSSLFISCRKLLSCAAKSTDWQKDGATEYLSWFRQSNTLPKGYNHAHVSWRTENQTHSYS